MVANDPFNISGHGILKMSFVGTSDDPGRHTVKIITMLTLTDFDYHLPDKNIAQVPSSTREESRLCVLKKDKTIVDSSFGSLCDFIPEGSLVVLNNTSVFSSRLSGKLVSGGKVEIFLLGRPYEHKVGDRQDTTRAVCLGRPMKKLKPGTTIQFDGNISAKIISKSEKLNTPEVTVEFQLPATSIYQWLEQNAITPLPPYIKRSENDPRALFDKDRYQTVYAKHTGSVAAPTAGLHFSDHSFSKLNEKGIDICELTLHVGAGTFMPVKTDDVSKHHMHKETFLLPLSSLKKIREAKENGRNIVVVGTTVFRALESIAERTSRDFDAAENLCETWLDTDLFVRPKTKEDLYRPWIADALLTNFHQPKSTLFMLICALIGYDQAKHYYERALREDYRFFSYGDSNLLWL